MPDDPNLFDDDSLFPDWLRDSQSGDEEDESGLSSGPDSPPWMQKPGQPPPPASTGNLPPPPWMQQSGPAKPPTGPLEVLPWSTSPVEPGAPSEPEDEGFRWNEPGSASKTPGRTAGEIPRGLTAALPWMDADEQRPGTPEQFTMDDLISDFDAGSAAPPEQLPSLRDRLQQPPAEEADWMSSFGQAASSEPGVPADDDSDWLAPGQSESPEQGLPSWLDESAFDEQPAGEDRITYTPGPEAAAMFADLDEIQHVEPVEPPPPPPKAPSVIRRIRQMEEAPPPESVFDDFGAAKQPTDLSYEEWEQLQIEREREEQKTPEERMMEEVPDWFDQIAPESGEPAPAPPTPEKSGGPEFVPGWFLGLEDQNPEEAPDWFQKIDYSTGPSAGLPPEPSAAEPAREPSPADLPDWFKGTETPGMNLDSVFGASPDQAALPDWMAGSGAGDNLPMPEMDALLSDTESGEVPDWLAATAPQADIMAQPEDIPFPDLDLDQEMAAPGADEGLEDWMLPFTPSQVEGRLRGEPPAEEDFVERFDPDELQQSAPAPIDEDAPDWLREMAMDEPSDERPAQEVAQPARGLPGPAHDELDWLSGISADDVMFEPQAEAPIPEARPLKPPVKDEAEFDSHAIDQLLNLYTPPSEPAWQDEEEWPQPAAEESPEVFGVQTAWEEESADLAALLSDEDLEKTLPLPPQPSPAQEALLHAPQVQPDWVSEIRPSDLPVTMKFGGVEVSVKQKQILELPDRVRLFHDSSLQETPKPAAPPAPASGPLAGIEGALPLVDLGLARDITAQTYGQVITPEQQIRVNRLQALLDVAAGEEEAEDEFDTLEPGQFSFEETAETEADIYPRLRRRSRFKVDRLIVSLLLFAGLIAPFITDRLHFAADPPPLGDHQQDVAAEVDQLVAGDYVLFALEYGPTAAGELDPLAEAVLRDALSRGAIPLTLSTNPAGALHAQAVIAPLVDDEKLLAARGVGEEALEPGKDYMLLSYLSGEAVGVRSLSDIQEDSLLSTAFNSDLQGEDSGLNIDDLEADIALIVVTGEDTEDIRTWAEQLNEVNVPKVALVTASVEPMTTAYLNEDAYAGYLAGYRDTISYNTARNVNSREPYEVPDGIDFDLPNPETSRWHSMALGAGIAAALIALGLVINLFRGLLRRSRR